jgi:microcystin-dependent protein
MSEPFLSEVRIFSFNFPPKGWAFCNGQFLPINQNQALFSLLGTTYGGNGQTTFALPNLKGRLPIHFGNGHILGETGGQSSVTLTQQQLPTHTHSVSARTDVVLPDPGPQDPSGKFYAKPQVAMQGGNVVAANLYAAPAGPVALNPGAVSNAGGSQAHNNMMPFLTLSFCIALQGIFPTRN